MKRFLTMILSLCLMLTLNSAAFAQDVTDTDAVSGSANTIPLDVIIDDWIEANYEGDAIVSRIVRLYSSYENSGQCIGHLVSFEKNNVPAGYVVLSREENGNPVIEFALSGESVYDRIECFLTEDNIDDVASNYVSVEDKAISSYSVANANILYTDFVNYSMAIEKNDEIRFLNQYNQMEDVPEQLQNIGVSPLSDSMDPGYQAPTETGPYDSEIIPGALSECGLIMGKMPRSHSGNCGPTSATNIVNMYAKFGLNEHNYLPNLLLNSSTDDTYTRLEQLSGFTEKAAASMDQLQAALETYCSERNASCSVGKYWFNWWSDYTRDVGKDLPIWLYTCGYGEAGAHAQVVVGWRSYPGGSKYLEIYTGWTKNATFVKFKADCFKYFEGRVVAIS